MSFKRVHQPFQLLLHTTQCLLATIYTHTHTNGTNGANERDPALFFLFCLLSATSCLSHLNTKCIISQRKTKTVYNIICINNQSWSHPLPPSQKKKKLLPHVTQYTIPPENQNECDIRYHPLKLNRLQTQQALLHHHHQFFWDSHERTRARGPGGRGGGAAARSQTYKFHF